MTPEHYQKFCEILDRRHPDLTVLTDPIHKTHNLSAIIRTCDAVGIHEFTQPNLKEATGNIEGDPWEATAGSKYMTITP